MAYNEIMLINIYYRGFMLEKDVHYLSLKMMECLNISNHTFTHGLGLFWSTKHVQAVILKTRRKTELTLTVPW